MKAVVLTAYGDVGNFVLRDVPDPKAERGAIVVRMAGGSINPIDWKMRSGAAKDRFPVQLPAILGRDAAGEVIEVGPGVDAFAVGDKVLGLVWQAYAERVAAPVDAWARLPAGLDVVDAGALPLILLTGAQLAEEAVRPVPGHVVLVTGAVGSVGRAALFGARAAGAKVWAGVEVATRGGGEARSVRRRRARRRGGLEPSAYARRHRRYRRRRIDQEAYDKLKPGGVIQRRRRADRREGARLHRACVHGTPELRDAIDLRHGGRPTGAGHPDCEAVPPRARGRGTSARGEGKAGGQGRSRGLTRNAGCQVGGDDRSSGTDEASWKRGGVATGPWRDACSSTSWRYP